jgi:hypothetical protein
MSTIDTTPIYHVLNAFLTNDVSALTAAFTAMDKDKACAALEDGEALSRSLCRVLATIIIKEDEEKIDVLVPILERCHEDMGIDFGISYQHLRKNKSNPELLRVINESGYKKPTWTVESIMTD